MQHEPPLYPSIISRLVEIANEDARIEALGIGGSFAKGGADEFSDIDVFLLVQAEALTPFVADLPALTSRLGTVVYEFTRPGLEGWGAYYHWATYEMVLSCDFMINTHESLRPHPLRKHTQVILDKTGFMTEFTLEQRRQSLGFDEHEEFCETSDWFWHDIDKCCHYLGRNSLWNALFFVEQARSKLFRMIRLEKHQVEWPEQPYRAFESLIGAQQSETLSMSLCRYDRASISAALVFIITQFKVEAQRVAEQHRFSDYLSRRAAIELLADRWLHRANVI